jgi:hypothetical protein
MKTVVALVVLGTVLSGCAVEPLYRVEHRDGYGYHDRNRNGVPHRYDRDRDGDGVSDRYDRFPDNPYRR